MGSNPLPGYDSWIERPYYESDGPPFQRDPDDDGPDPDDLRDWEIDHEMEE